MDVIKKLPAGAPGTRKLLGKYGAALICVRYRMDKQTGRRCKTVELIVEEYAPPTGSGGASLRHTRSSPEEVLIRIGFGETELRSRIKAAGGRWLVKEKLWQISYPNAVRLGLLDRIAGRI